MAQKQSPARPGQRPVVLVTRRMPPDVTARVQRDYDARLNADDHIYSRDELLAAAQGCDALLVCSSDKMTAEVFERLPKSVRIVATFSVGYDHIDVEASRRRGIITTNTPDVLTDATADIAMLLLLGAARRAYEGETMVRTGQWKNWNTMMMLGKHVTGARLGIYGMGRIGQAVARRARGFDMKIHYHNRTRLSPDLEQGAVYHDTPEKLLAVSDFLSLHCPSTSETKKFLNTARIASMPDRAIVINTARGDVVDDEALIAALRSGKLAAAGLDVFTGEPNLHPDYKTLPNTMLLPHIGSATMETRNAMGFTALDNIDAVLAGRPAPNPLWR